MAAEAAAATPERLKGEMPWKAYECEGVRLTYGNQGLVAKDAADVPRLLEEYGVAVLFGVLDEAECTAMRDGAWATAEFLLKNAEVPLRRDDPSTHASTRLLQPHHGGLFQWHRWAHAQYVWDVRANRKCMAPFQHIFGEEDLVVSYDGINFGTGYSEYCGHHKLHIDQDFREKNVGQFRCVQSWVTSEPVNIGDATFRCLPKSHLLHGEFAGVFGIDSRHAKPDWHVLAKKSPTPQLKWYTEEHGLVDTCITCPAGSMVLWDSRTVHSGIEKLPGTNALRNLCYLCYMPRKWCKAGFETRRRIFDKRSGDMYLRTCSHWPDAMRPFGLYPPDFRVKKREDLDAKWAFVPKLPAPKLDRDAQRVAGLI